MFYDDSGQATEVDAIRRGMRLPNEISDSDVEAG